MVVLRGHTATAVVRRAQYRVHWFSPRRSLARNGRTMNVVVLYLTLAGHFAKRAVEVVP